MFVRVLVLAHLGCSRWKAVKGCTSCVRRRGSSSVWLSVLQQRSGCAVQLSVTFTSCLFVYCSHVPLWHYLYITCSLLLLLLLSYDWLESLCNNEWTCCCGSWTHNVLCWLMDVGCWLYRMWCCFLNYAFVSRVLALQLCLIIIIIIIIMFYCESFFIIIIIMVITSRESTSYQV